MLAMSPREARVIRNETLFREVNVRIADLHEGALSLGADELMSLVCECASAGCAVPIQVDPATFEQVRAQPTCKAHSTTRRRRMSGVTGRRSRISFGWWVAIAFVVLIAIAVLISTQSLNPVK